MRISVIGLGKLGSPLAAVLASKGHEVVAVDVNAEAVDHINAGRAPVIEPRLQDLIDQSCDRLRATTDYEDAILNTDISFLIVPTPSDETGLFSNAYVLSAVAEIGRVLRRKTSYHVVNVTSTVVPGSMGGEIADCLEHHSGRTVGDTVGLCYNPEFIALGSVVHDLLRPDMILLGESDARAGDAVAAVYRTTCENDAPIRRISLINAEIVKISVNTYVTTKISYANMLAELCERLPGADANVVADAVGLDTRIGGKYLKPALGYGGPCFPRDNVAFAALAHRVGARADIAEATDRINRHQPARLLEMVRDVAPPGARVGILGLSYKPDTEAIDESQGVALALELSAQGYRPVVFDPRALPGAQAVLGSRAQAASSVEECLAAADVVVITTPWPQFRAPEPAALRRLGRRLPIIDCWRLLDPEVYGAVVDLIYLGCRPVPLSAGPAAGNVPSQTRPLMPAAE